MKWPRGKGLGGSSRINAMIWFPPTDHDFQMIDDLTGNRLGLSGLKQRFQVLTQRIGPESPRWTSAVCQRFLDVAQRAATQADPGPHHPMLYRRFNRSGKRWTSAQLLDAQPLGDGRIDLVRGQVDRVVLTGDQATGVRLVDGEVIHARQRVILSAGSIATPTILMRSGIGDAEHLRAHGIDSIIDLPGVGRGLQDHLIMPMIFSTAPEHQFACVDTPRDLAQWQAVGGGPIACNIAECGGLFYDETIQLHVTPTHYLLFPHPKTPPAMTIGINVTRPLSQGRLRLQSSDPRAMPMIDPPYLTNPSDTETLLRGMRLARQIADEMSLAGHEILPGAKRVDDESLIKSISRYSQTLYHPVGTCGGGNRELAVCDDRLFVRNVSGLQIVDASVFPAIPTGNPSTLVLLLAMLTDDTW
ncbi:Alcohol dehydrogenase [acceptor] [Stieleria varia]|uniref:Alcohol dehydrogenase [acceptor] n=2 Tax=Stieleria varia TaxID=2528005 RepID=A0A5C6B9G6_9BACT|nr:Alcohol dehydrogenase [acceptor] [Stieleria varia]